ncbi:F-box domain [Dillenia turbinata]|uniref:F-box domain n=1 Tax=Dillenia turbinata TaxID=194707 RepID=A0AAN8ZLP1_9MAGN
MERITVFFVSQSVQKQREPAMLPCRTELEPDRISNLPGHVTDNILSHLSLRDAVRTSILSSKWRYKWMTLPNLVFDNQCVAVPSQDQTLIRNKLVNVIDHVLLLHSGTIHKFKLSHRDLQGVNDIAKWILFLSRVSVQELILEIWKGPRYKLPSCIYTCQKLVHLELFNCTLRPPLTFKGFRSLKSLDLQHITLAQDVFENLISSCTLLERLTLMNFDGFTCLNIHAPNLLFVDVGGVLEDVNFKSTCLLAIVSIGLYMNVANDQIMARGNSGSLLKFLSNLPHIQRLEIQSYFLRYLAMSKVPVKLPVLCEDLTYLSIHINFNHLGESSAALCLLRSAPNLQELEMLARPEENNVVGPFLNFWAVEDHWNSLFDQLRIVKIVGISGGRPELECINFLLSNSPVLEKMTVKPASLAGGWDLLKELLRFRRASVRAEIIFLDP